MNGVIHLAGEESAVMHPEEVVIGLSLTPVSWPLRRNGMGKYDK